MPPKRSTSRPSRSRSHMTTLASMTLDDLPLDEAARTALEALSRRLNRSPEVLAARAVRNIVADTEALLRAGERGLADVRAGRTVDGDAMEKWLESWGDDDEQEPPPCK